MTELLKQMAECKRLADVCPELNLSNYGPDDVDELNAWAIEVAQAIDALFDAQAAEQAVGGGEAVPWYEDRNGALRGSPDKCHGSKPAAIWLDSVRYTHPAPAAPSDPQPKGTEPLTWYDGPPPFPQDQEWFIAETTYGDRVVLRSLDEGREHKGNYAFKTADGTYMKTELVKRWMQFPDCEYLPPAPAPAESPAAPVQQVGEKQG